MNVIKGDLARAIEHHRAGRLSEAEELYRSILARDERHVDARHLMGVLARQTGRVQLALQSLEQALALQGPDATLLHNRACALSDAGRVDEAEAAWREALRLQAGFPEAALRLSALCRERGDRAGAGAILKDAIERHPRHVELNLATARELERRGKYGEALARYKRVVAAAPGLAKAYVGGGGAWMGLGQVDNAVRWFREALRLEPRSVAAWNALARALQHQSALAAAVEAYREALRVAPDSFELHTNLGTALQENGQCVEAIGAHARAQQLRPSSPVPYTHMGMAYAEMGQFERAFDCYHRAIAIDTNAAEARMNRAMLLVQHGRFAEGWDEYEWRTRTADAPRRRAISCEAWRGDSLAGRRLLVHGEQGIGDEIMFASCLADVASQAEHCYVTCDRRLGSLFARSFPRTTVLGVERGGEDWEALGRLADCHVAAGSLPRFLRRREADFPRRQNYLLADRAATDGWRARLAELGPGMKVGLAWRGGVGRPRGGQRSFDVRRLTALLRAPGVEFVNLQYGEVQADLERMNQETGSTIHRFEELDLRDDLDGAAALISALDLVVAVGSATVHLAGALGTPTWCLLPRYWGWRWLIGRSDSVWYTSVRLYRQREAGRWDGVLTTVGEELWRTAARWPRR